LNILYEDGFDTILEETTDIYKSLMLRQK